MTEKIVLENYQASHNASVHVQCEIGPLLDNRALFDYRAGLSAYLQRFIVKPGGPYTLAAPVAQI